MRTMKMIIVLVFISTIIYSQQPMKINVDATKIIAPLDPFWAGITFHPTEYLSTQWGEELLRLLAESGAARTFIRLYNQPENAIRVAEDGAISYDWSEFDKRARLILSTDAKPLVVFFGMTFQLALYPDAQKKRSFGAIVSISPPKDYKQWEQLCADFTRHVIDVFGVDEVKQWYFRCWNEPDLADFWHDADVEEYNKLYDYFAHGVKKVHSDIRIGGGSFSSTRTYQNPQQLRVFFNHVTKGKNYATGKTGSPIDYISAHIYGGHGGAGGPGWDYPAVDYVLTVQKKYYEILQDYPELEKLPLFLDEWGVSAGGTRGVDAEPITVTRNNEYGAAFFAALVAEQIEMQQITGRRFNNMMFCVSGYERRRSSDFMGLRTLHTRNGFHKPILNAYKMLDKLGDMLVETKIAPASPAIHTVATRDAGRIAVLVTNYQHDQPLGSEDLISLSLAVRHDWHGLVQVHHWRIDREHSNAYTEYIQSGKPEFPNPLEIQRIRDKMGLEMIDSFTLPVSRQGIDILFELPCNAVSLYEFILKP